MEELSKLMDVIHSTIKFWVGKKEIHLYRAQGKWNVLFDEDDNWLYRGDSFDDALEVVKEKIKCENKPQHEQTMIAHQE